MIRSITAASGALPTSKTPPTVQWDHSWPDNSYRFNNPQKGTLATRTHARAHTHTPTHTHTCAGFCSPAKVDGQLWCCWKDFKDGSRPNLCTSGCPAPPPCSPSLRLESDAWTLARPRVGFVLFDPRSPLSWAQKLDCYWVGSLDFNLLVEIKLGFPLNPQKVIHFLQGGQQQPSKPDQI